MGEKGSSNCDWQLAPLEVRGELQDREAETWAPMHCRPVEWSSMPPLKVRLDDGENDPLTGEESGSWVQVQEKDVAIQAGS